MKHIKLDCDYCPIDPPDNSPRHHHRDWESHPSLIAGIESLHAYSHWVSSIVLPVAFQWIDEHRAEVYATIPEELKDDVGTVLAAAFKLIKDQPAYQRGVEKAAGYDTTVANGDTATINPSWTAVTQKVRTHTEGAFAEHPSLLVG